MTSIKILADNSNTVDMQEKINQLITEYNRLVKEFELYKNTFNKHVENFYHHYHETELELCKEEKYRVEN